MKSMFASNQGRRHAASWKKGKEGKLVPIGKGPWTKVQNFDQIYGVIRKHDIAFMTKLNRIYTWIGLKMKGWAVWEKVSVWTKDVVVQIEKGWCQTLCNQSVLWNVWKICKHVFKWNIRKGQSYGYIVLKQ